MASSFPAWCAASGMRWLLALAFASAVVLALFLSGLRLSGFDLPSMTLGIGGLAFVAWRYRLDLRGPRLSAVAEAELLLILILTSSMVLSYAAGTSGMPYRDAALHQADQLIGFDWHAYAGLIDSSPLLTRLGGFAYNTLLPQALLVPIALAVAGRFERLHLFLIALILSLAVTCAVFAIAPAVSVYAFLDVPLGSFENIRPTNSFQHVGPLEALRDGTMATVDLGAMHGLITFPSFHSCGAALLIWAFWDVKALRYPALALNLLMLMATPIDGAHYAVDVIAGVGLACASVWAAAKLSAFAARPAAASPALEAAAAA